MLRSTLNDDRITANRGVKIPSDIYKWFTESFDTADLKDAKALLEEFRE